MMEITREDPTAIRIPKRLREIKPDKIKQLAESMGAIGLQQPVTIWRPTAGDLELVAGAHRTQAACDLGWKWIDVIDAKGMTDIDRQLWEIDENLMRADLSPTEHDEHLAKRKELWARRDTGPICPTIRGAGQPKQFAADTAAATGISKRSINRSISRVEAIPGDIRAIIKYTRLDTGTYLDGLKGMAPVDQREKVIADLAEPSVQLDADIRAANRRTAAVGKPLRDVQQVWRRASAEDRRRIKVWILEQETPAETGGGQP